MKPYFIILKNSKTKERFHRATYWASTFPEAVREAYLIKAIKGHEWSISSVSVDTQWEMRNGRK